MSQVDEIITGPEMEPSANIGGSDRKYCIKKLIEGHGERSPEARQLIPLTPLWDVRVLLAALQQLILRETDVKAGIIHGRGEGQRVLKGV